jgi:hypothetical protein
MVTFLLVATLVHVEAWELAVRVMKGFFKGAYFLGLVLFCYFLGFFGVF